MIIWDGPHRVDTEDPTTWRIGELKRTDGSRVAVFRDNIMQAYSDAVGSPPPAPPLLGPGILHPTYTSIRPAGAFGPYEQIVTGYVYDPGPGELNAALVAEYKAAVEGWSAHAAAQKDILEVLLRTSGR